LPIEGCGNREVVQLRSRQILGLFIQKRIQKGLSRDVPLACLIEELLRRRDPRDRPYLRVFFNQSLLCHHPRQKLSLDGCLVRYTTAFIVLTDRKAGQTRVFIPLIIQ